ncbi:MAG: Stp1/IreP family PP2C-type Ser/Thr phosphatase [Turicibacter sp.]|nr:Stp1/IreP family PP2C-type Ser/Thr phosphatase [Turicibacter sp.]
MLKMSVQTNVGKSRIINQDTVFASLEPEGLLPNLFIVADGMGGHNGGEVASRLAVDYFCDFVKGVQNDEYTNDPLDLLTSATAAANLGVLSYAKDRPELYGMGTTLTACSLTEEPNRCNITHIGDSRVYAITEHSITQLTNDHSYVNEMVKAGHMTKSEAKVHPKRNVLTKVLGISPDMLADGHVFDIEPKSYVLICSDGLYNMVSENEIKKIVTANNGEAAKYLVDAANDNGGRDNISVVVIKYEIN